MTSVLAQQLQQLAEARGDATARRVRGKPSLLFDYQKAADVDIQTIFNIAVQGLEQLSGIDSRFQPYSSTLFARSSLSVNREQITKQEDAKLNQQIAALLRLLSNHFLSPACFKVLEYLIRRYRVNEINVDDLMAAALPYHATNEFVRLVQTARLEATAWTWLSKMQDTGAALPRDILVKRCTGDNALLAFICETAKQQGSTRQLCRTWLSFYAVTVCELVAAHKTVPEELVSVLLPYLTAGLQAEASQDYRAASLMVVTQICARASLGKEFLSAIIAASCKSASAEDTRTVLMVLAHMALTQPQYKSLSAKAVKAVLDLPGLAEQMASLCEAGSQVQPLLALLLRSFTYRAAAEEQAARVLADLAAVVPLAGQAEAVAERLMTSAEGLAADDEGRQRLMTALRAFELRYPSEVDAAVNKVLSSSQQGLQHQQLVAFVAETFQGSSLAPIEGGAAMTVASAVDAPAEQLRCAALASIDDLCQKEDPDLYSLQLLQSAVERRLADDSLDVLAAVLRMRSLALVPAAELANGLAKLLARLEAMLQDSSTGKEAAIKARALAQQALGALAAAAARDASLADEAMCTLCSFLFASSRRGRKVAEAALSAAASVQHPFAASLAAAASAVSAASAEQQPAGKKAKGKAAAAASAAEPEPWEVARAAVEHLSDAAQQDAAVAGKLAELLAMGSAKAQLLLLLALQRVAAHSSASGSKGRKGQQQQGERTAELLPAVLDAAEASLSSSKASQLAGWQEQVQQYVDDSGLPLKEACAAAQKQPQHAQQVLLLQALKALFEAASPAALQALCSSPAQCFARLAKLQPAEAVAEQVQLAMGKMAGAELAAALCDVAAAPSGYTAAVRARALAALPVAVSSSSDAAAQLASQVPMLLAALSSGEDAVRHAAVACAAELAEVATGAAPWLELFTALTEQAGLVKANAAAATAALNAALRSAPQQQQQKPRGKGKAATAAQAADTSTTGAALELSPDAVSELRSLLMQQLSSLAGPSGLAGAEAVLAALLGAVPDQEVLSKGLPLLAAAVSDLLSGAASKAVAQQQAVVAARLATLFSPAAVAAPQQADALFAVLSSGTAAAEGAAAGTAEALAAVRAAAITACTTELFAALQAQQQADALRLLLQASSADPSQQCRAAARGALELLPITSTTLLPLLTVSTTTPGVQQQPTPAKKKTRKGKAQPAAAAEAAVEDATAAAAVDPAALDRAVSALELLQWKADVSEPAALLQPLQALLQVLLPAMDSVAVAHSEHGPEEPAAAEQQAGKSSAAGYAAQLALAYLTGLSKQELQPGQGIGQFDMGLVVRLAQRAPDSAVRNAALALLALLADKAPQAALEHVLQVLALVHHTSAMYSDSYSAQVATTALSAVVPAWLAAGRDPAQLFSSVTSSLGQVPPHRRLPLLSTMVSAMQEATALPIALLLLLQQLAKQQPARKQAQQEGAQQEAGAEEPWADDLAGALCAQASPEVLLPALAAVMQRSAQLEAPHQQLPRITVAFVTAQLKLKSIQKAGSAAQQAAEADEEAAALQAGCQAIMGQALQQLQALNLQQLREQQGPKAAKAGRAAAQALYDVFKAMQGLLDAGSYLAATLQLVQSDQDKVRRRALRLFAERLAALQASLDSEDSELSARVKERRLAAAAGPALQLCQLLPGFLSATGAKAPSAMTRQAALLALEPVARMYGGQAPEQLLASLPSVLAAAADKGSAAVRASALACTATIVKALGPKIVGQLPATAEAVLAAVARAQQQVSSSAAAPAADSDVEEEQEGASAAEEAALELSSGLAAVDAMVRTLGAFVSPYLPRLLQSLLQPAVLACKAAGCSAFAAEIRAGLPAAIPARLLFQPLFGQWEHAAAVAAAGSADVSSAVALLGMVSSAASHMDSKSAAAYHEQFFAFLLTALDARQQRLLPAASPALLQLEAAAVQALVSLVMKLSEARFKPLFLRLLDWAAPASGAAGSGSGPGRVATLLACADAITARLRSVFVPYFKHLQDICIQQLTGAGSDQQQPKKKRKKGADATAAAAAAGGATEDPEAVLTGWLARMRAVRALHRCLLHDTVSFLDQDRFQALLPPLVAQLDAAAPADVLPVLAEQCAAADLEAGLRLGARTELDALRTAAVACLTQMAITGNSDTLWKPLNHQSLMVTRSGSAASRLAGLEVLAQLVAHLNEEFISLIPETIPFLAELVEDSEAVVEARAQEVVKLLEEASGEKLDQYMR